MSSMLRRWPLGAGAPLRSTPYPTPPLVIAGCGAIVTNCPCCLGGATGQFSGRLIFIGPRSAATIRWLGRTLCNEIGLAAFADPRAATVLAPFDCNVAPFF